MLTILTPPYNLMQLLCLIVYHVFFLFFVDFAFNVLYALIISSVCMCLHACACKHNKSGLFFLTQPVLGSFLDFTKALPFGSIIGQGESHSSAKK